MENENTKRAAMIPKTQSVCKHCRRPKYEHDGIALFCRTKSVYQFEPVAEPASTGEPPRKWERAMYRINGIIHHFESTHGVKLTTSERHELCELLIKRLDSAHMLTDFAKERP